MKTTFLSLILWAVSFSLFAQSIELIVPIGHTRRVTDFQLSPDGKWFASADGSVTVKLWETSSAREYYHLQHDQPVQAVGFIQSTIVTGDNSGNIYFWNQNGSRSKKVEAGKGAIVTLIPKGTDSLFVISSGKAALLNAKDGTQLIELKTGLESISSGILLGDKLILGDQLGNIATMAVNGGKPSKNKIANGRVGSITKLSETEVVLGSDAGELIRLNLNNWEHNTIQPFTLRNYAVTYDAANDLIYACGRDDKHNIQVFSDNDLKSRELPFTLDIDKDSEAFKFGLRAMKIFNDSLLVIADYNQNIRTYDLKNDLWSQSFTGKAAPIYDMSLDRTGKWLAIASGNEQVKVLDLTGIESDRFLIGNKLGSRAVDFHPVTPVLAVYGTDDRIRVMNTTNGDEIFELKAKGEYSSTPITFDPTGRYILRKSSENDFDFYNFKTKTPKNLKVKNGKKYAFTSDGRRLIFSTVDGLAVYDAITQQKLKELSLPDVQDLNISGTNNLAVLLKDDITVLIFDGDLNKQKEITLEAPADEIFQSPDEKHLIGIRNSVKRGEKSTDFTIKIFNAKTGKLETTLPGHDGFVTDVEFANGYLLTSSIDGKINIWDLSKNDEKPKGSIIPLNNSQYVITTQEGLFDATSEAMKELHYIKEGKKIDLDQLKDTYYEPKLLSKILGLNKEPIRSVDDLSSVSLYPELEIKHPLKNNGMLGIDLHSNGGGIGRVVILINGKEVSSDVRSAAVPEGNSLEINYDLANHPFLYNDKVSKITVMAYNEDGTLSTDEKSIYVFGEEKKTVAPRLFALVAGSSDYAGDNLDLKYAAKDASDLADAVKLSATEYLGAENVNMTLLTTDQSKELWPTKENIQNAFKYYATQATANDLLLVYISGHGVNKGGENSDFYYLTCTASDGDMDNAEQREQAAISSAEFTEYIKSVPALKQILIIDACHSGRLASSIASSRDAMSSTQIRALERMKDRTGMFVLAGSAADAVSYETTLYGQGLLTYSLLFGMKGAALRDDGFVDVLELFQFAADKVPELAEEIGGIQKPEIRMPQDGKSFDIGRLTETEREQIRIKAPKPVYVNTRFQDESAIYDPLHISDLMDSKLSDAANVKDAKMVYVDDKIFSGAIVINGRYSDLNDLLKAEITLVTDGIEMDSFTLEAVNEDQLTSMLLEKILGSTDH